MLLQADAKAEVSSSLLVWRAAPMSRTKNPRVGCSSASDRESPLDNVRLGLGVLPSMFAPVTQIMESISWRVSWRTPISCSFNDARSSSSSSSRETQIKTAPVDRRDLSRLVAFSSRGTMSTVAIWEFCWCRALATESAKSVATVEEEAGGKPLG